MSRAGVALAFLLLLAAPAEALLLRVGEAVAISYPGATAAFAVDPSLVEAGVDGGEVRLAARRPGRTIVTVLLRESVETLTVEVEAPPARALPSSGAAIRPSAGWWEARYDSGTGRLGATLVAGMEQSDRSVRLRLYGMSESSGRGADTLRSLPSASLHLAAPGREVVLFDELVELSALTLDGTVLRGLHLHRGGLELHAGVASATPWDDVLVPEDGDRALALAYSHGVGGLRLIPTIAWLPDSEGDARGVASLGLARGSGADALQMRGEIGWGGAPGGALELTYAGERQRGWLWALHRPVELSALGIGRPPGSFLDGAWAAQLSGRARAELTLSASALDLVGRRQEAGAARLELRYQASERWNLTATGHGGAYRDRDRSAARHDHRGASLGAGYQGERLGLAGIYRYQQSSAAGRPGHGGRFTLRAGGAGWRGSVYLDAQQEAPTLDLVLRSRPGLERALAELGLTARTPDEIVRLLRDNAALFAEHGVQVGDLEVDPLHLQGGVEIAWRGRGPGRSELGLRVTADEARGLSADRRSTISTLSASRRLLGDTDLGVAYTRWSTTSEGAHGRERDSMQVTLRTQVGDLPSLPGRRRRAIQGSVGRDDRAHGDLDGELLPLGGVEVVLDGVRRTRTDSDGRFAFERVGGGAHRVEVVLPEGAYFTSVSPLTLPAGSEARFAITFSAARLRGHVRSDGGAPLAGVAVRLDIPLAATVTTDSEGAFALTAPAGDVRLSVLPDSLPPGFELAALDPVTVRLRIGAPARQDLVVRAQRSVAGIVGGANPGAVTVTALELGRRVTVGSDGRFVIRELPAGRMTLLASGPQGEAREVVEVPIEPVALHGIELLPAPSAAPAVGARR